MDRQFTATTYIIDKEEVLLIKHKKLNKWLPPGGHIESNETPPETARREALEETGLEVKILRQENLWITRDNATSFERPFLCLEEYIPSYKETPAHQHIDFIYVANPIGGKITHNHEETDDIRWFSLEAIEQLKGDEDIYEETRETLRLLLSSSITFSQ